MVYLIAYDLNNPRSSHKEVEKVIKKISVTYCSFWKSSYLKKSNMASSQIVELLKPCLDDADRLFNVQSTDDYQGWLTDEQWNFIDRSIYK